MWMKGDQNEVEVQVEVQLVLGLSNPVCVSVTYEIVGSENSHGHTCLHI